MALSVSLIDWLIDRQYTAMLTDHVTTLIDGKREPSALTSGVMNRHLRLNRMRLGTLRKHPLAVWSHLRLQASLLYHYVLGRKRQFLILIWNMHIFTSQRKKYIKSGKIKFTCQSWRLELIKMCYIPGRTGTNYLFVRISHKLQTWKLVNETTKKERKKRLE